MVLGLAIGTVGVVMAGRMLRTQLFGRSSHHLRAAGIADRPGAADDENGVGVDFERGIVDARVIVLAPVEDDRAALQGVGICRIVPPRRRRPSSRTVSAATAPSSGTIQAAHRSCTLHRARAACRAATASTAHSRAAPTATTNSGTVKAPRVLV